MITTILLTAILGAAIGVAVGILLRLGGYAGAVDMRDPIQNTGRKFGADRCYYIGTVIDGDGKPEPVLWTLDQIEVARARRRANPEDVRQ